MLVSFTAHVNNDTKKNLLLLGICFSFLLPIKAYSFCFEPSNPGYFNMSKPTTPYCVNEWNNTHTCEQWVIENYYNELSNYNSSVDNYINDLNEYVRDANSYAECLVNRL
jgi:hypothetical protein